MNRSKMQKLGSSQRILDNKICAVFLAKHSVQYHLLFRTFPFPFTAELYYHLHPGLVDNKTWSSLSTLLQLSRSSLLATDVMGPPAIQVMQINACCILTPLQHYIAYEPISHNSFLAQTSHIALATNVLTFAFSSIL